MTIRNVTKNYIGMEDIQAGVGTQDQVRNEATVTMGKVDVPYAVSSEAELQALDVTRFTNARIYSSSVAFVDYRYDPADVTGITPITGSGSWIAVVLSTEHIEHDVTGGSRTLAEYLDSQKLTLTEAVNSTALFNGAVVTITDRDNETFDVVLASSVTPNGMDVIQCTIFASLALVLRVTATTLPTAMGYTIDTSGMTSTALVDANWAIMKAYIALMNDNNLSFPHIQKLLTMKQIYAHWISGTSKPLGFYSDSTTDGAKTTGHVPSTGSDSSPFSVTINTSPNSYPVVLQGLANGFGPAKTTAECYNGGFDSESYRSGFGLQHWYNTWFRAAGSNVNWTDVAAIALAFGVSDSANEDDTATVIANYSIDLECTIIDCFLRGVQPILQTPVITTQHFGNTGGAKRNGDQTTTIINAVQDNLAKKYNLEQLTYGQTQLDALDGFDTFRYGELISPAASDQVHPIDLGHRMQAGYLFTEMCGQVKRVSTEVYNAFAGSPNYKVVDESLNITDDVLLRSITDYGALVEMFGEYFYKFEATTAADTELLRLPVYIERPSTVFYVPIDTSVIQPSFLINNTTHDDNSTIASAAVEGAPLDVMYTGLRRIASLRYGLNQIIVKSNAAGGVQKVGGLYVIPNDLLGSFDFLRLAASGTVFFNREFNFRDSLVPHYNTYDVNNVHPIWMRYKHGDNNFSTISFTLTDTLTSTTEYPLWAYFNDHEDKADCYNIFKLNSGGVADEFAVSKVVTGTTTQVATTSISGLSAKLVAGARVEIKIRPKHYLGNPAGVTDVQIHIDGVNQGPLSVPYGDMWTTGYGIVMNTIVARDISINSIESLTGPTTDIT